jgi:hypothetical protein
MRIGRPLRVRFFHDRKSRHQKKGYVAFQNDQEAVPQVGDIVFDPRDVAFPDPFYVSLVEWYYHSPLSSTDTLAYVDILLTPLGKKPKVKAYL